MSPPSSAVPSVPSVPQPATWRAWWSLLRPYWASDQKWTPIGLFATLLALTFSLTYVRLAFTVWYGHYQQAVVKYDGAAIHGLLLTFVGILSLEVSVVVTNTFLNSALSIHWRKWLTYRFAHRWMSNKAFFWIEQEQLVDNPDQRICEDIDQFVLVSLSLVVGLYGTISTLIVFTRELWTKSGVLDFSLFGHAMQLPHYMVWIAIVYSALTTVIVQVAGRRLRPLTFRKQQAEADFRFGMTSVREHVEQIAMLGGGGNEITRMNRSFEQVRRNYWSIIYFNLRFQPVTLAVALISSLFASFALLPRYFAHGISFGDMSQLAANFGVVAGSMQWFIQNFTVLQQYRVVVSRLSGLDAAIYAGTRPRGPRYSRVDGAAIALNAISLETPQGQSLMRDVSLTINAGERWLIRGPSGAGKSTLLRALAGMWHHGHGEIRLPADARVLFLPQKNYLPPSSLKAALCYPDQADAFDHEVCRRALTECQLSHLAGNLDDIAAWGARLSPGEQQRLGFARVFLQRPDCVLLDESTSALDEDNEMRMYQMLLDRLPEATLISVSHHRVLDRLHTHTLLVDRGHAWPTVHAAVA